MDMKRAASLREGDVVITDAGTDYEYQTTVTKTAMTKTGKVTIHFSDGSRVTRRVSEWFTVYAD